jgi:hypothetical protein
VALRRHRAAFPTAPQFEWRVAGEFRPEPGPDEAEELRVAHVVHMPGSYCSAGDAGTGKRVVRDQ